MSSDLVITSAFRGKRLPTVKIAVLFGAPDEQLGQGIAQFFNRLGAGVWTKHDIGGGQEVAYATNVALKSADFIIMLVSSAVMGIRDDFHRHVRSATNVALLMPEGGVKLLPILVDDAARMPVILVDIVAFRLSDPQIGTKLLGAMQHEWDRRDLHHDW